MRNTTTLMQREYGENRRTEMDIFNVNPEVSEITTARVIEANDVVVMEVEDTDTRKNKVSREGESCEVYAFRTDEEINQILKVLNSKIEKAETDSKLLNAERNKLLFVIGINIGIRASDLRMLKWSFFFEEDSEGNRTFKDHYKFQPKKQRRCGKFVTVKFNDAVRNIVEKYISKYPVEDLDTYVFASQKGGEPIVERQLWNIIKTTAYEAGIKQNIGSHSLRKTFGYRVWDMAEDKDKALVMLQCIFKHSDTRTTMKYIGILQDDLDEMYDGINLGMEN